MQPRSPARLWAYGLDQDTRQALHSVGQIVIPHLDTVLSDFYVDVVATPDWSNFFRDPKLMAHARARQKIHWERMFTAEYGEDYFAQADRIGRIHYKIGLPLRHYVASYARVAAALQRILAAQRPRRALLSRRGGCDHADVLTRALMLDIELAVSGFHDAQTEDFAGRMAQLGTSFESEVSRVVDVLNGSMGRLNDAANGLDEEIVGARQGAGVVSANAVQIATSSHSVAAAIEQLSASIASITHDVVEAASAAGIAAGEAEASATQVAALQAAVEEIGEVVSLISAIARQTNLLAVNATVEAARAGESGKGFAVVAFEVKALAQRISEATSSIGQRIERIQAESGSMAARMTGISDSVRRMTSLTESIRVAVDEQKQAARHITTHAETTAASTNEMADMIHDVSTRVERSGATSQTLKEAVATVSGETAALSDRVRRFLGALRAA